MRQKNSGQHKCQISLRSVKWHQFEENLTIQNNFLVLCCYNIIANLILCVLYSKLYESGIFLKIYLY